MLVADPGKSSMRNFRGALIFFSSKTIIPHFCSMPKSPITEMAKDME